MHMSHNGDTLDVDRNVSTAILLVFIRRWGWFFVSLFVACRFAAIGAFWSWLLFWLLDGVPSLVLIDWLLFCLIVGFQAWGILIPLSLLMFLGWSPIWIASLTLCMYHWGSQSINSPSFADIHLAPFTWDLVTNTVLFWWFQGVFRLY